MTWNYFLISSFKISIRFLCQPLILALIDGTLSTKIFSDQKIFEFSSYTERSLSVCPLGQALIIKFLSPRFIFKDLFFSTNLSAKKSLVDLIDSSFVKLNCKAL